MKGILLLIVNLLLILSIQSLVIGNRYLKKGVQLAAFLPRVANHNVEEGLASLDQIERIGFRLKFFQRADKKYIMDSGIGISFPWITLKGLIIVAIGSACGLSYWVWILFKIEGLIISGGLIGFVMPFQIIEIYKIYRFRQLINGLPGFYSVLQRWAQINEDIYFCLGQLENSGIHPRIIKPFKMFLLETTSGVPNGKAFYNLKRYFHGTPVIQFIRCLERLVEQRGDMVKLLQSFENESYQLQGEITERQNTQIKYKLLINGLSFLSFILIYGLINSNRVLSGFYVETTMGKILISVIAFLMALSFLGGIKYDRSY